MDHTECEVRSETPEAVPESKNSTQGQKVGDHIYPEQKTYLCGSVEEFRALEAEIGGDPPNWVSRWRWKPKDGLGWPRHGTDVY